MGTEEQPTGASLPGNTAQLLMDAISINSAYNSMIQEPQKPGEAIQQLGNKTECGLLGFVNKLGGNYAEIRKKFTEESHFKVGETSRRLGGRLQVYTFNSSRKCMMTVIRLIEEGKDVGYRVYCKGASEIVLGRWETPLSGGDRASSDART